MSVHLDRSNRQPATDQTLAGSRPGTAEWLCLAATPTFAAMALLTATTGADMLCMSEPDFLPVGGMVPMYLLMSVFHVGPWLNLFR